MAGTKFVAKLASEAAKPVASPTGPARGGVWSWSSPSRPLGLPAPAPGAGALGRGSGHARQLERLGVATVGDLADLRVESVVAALGRSNGRHLHALAKGHDPRVVEPDRRVKSIGQEETFARDHHRRHDPRTRSWWGSPTWSPTGSGPSGVVGRTVQIKVRFGDFRTITRARDPPRRRPTTGPRCSTPPDGSLAQIDPSPGVRLLGLSVSGLSDAGVRQMTFDDAARGPGWEEASRTVDEIRARFGTGVHRPGRAPTGRRTTGHPASTTALGPVGRAGARRRTGSATLETPGDCGPTNDD